MGMTLDEAIRISDRDSVMDSKAEVEARHVILATVQKYQKIEEIMDKRPKEMIRSNPTLNAIKGILEEEKDN